MKKMLAGLWTAIQFLCVVTVLLLAGLTAVLFMTGSLNKKRVASAFEALRGRTPEPVSAPTGTIAEEWARIEDVRRRMEETQRAREEEVAKLELLAKREYAQARAERLRAEAAIKDAEEKSAAVAKERKALEDQKITAVVESNLSIYKNVEADGLLVLMSSWSTADIVKYLRLMKPAKAAEVLDAMRADVRYNPPPPPPADGQAPKKQTRLEEIVAELQREK